MITAGIDVGLENIKLVILDEGKIIAKGTALSGGGGRGKAIDDLWESILKEAGITAAGVSKIVATGQGKFDVSFADSNITEAVADARAARYFESSATSIVDIGADNTRVVTLGDGDAITESVVNQKCMAGMGILLQVIANRLGMTIEELSSLPLDAKNDTWVNDGCPVFAELDALELLNDGVPVDEIASAVTNTVIVRLNSVLNDKIVPAKTTTVLIGGLTKNKAVVDGLKLRSEIDFIIPDDAEYGGAIGAAIIAAR